MAITDDIREVLREEPGLTRIELRKRLEDVDPASLSGSISLLKNRGELDCVPIGNSNLYKYSWIDPAIEKPTSLLCLKWGGLPSSHSMALSRNYHG